MNDLNTERLIIRRFQANDLADYLDYQTSPEVLLFMGAEPMSEEQGAKFITKQVALKDNQKGAYHAFAVHHRGDGKVIGDVGFYLDEGPENKGDLGFQFHPDYHRQGYAKEAVMALLGYGFTELGLNRITSGCIVSNVASFRLMESVGMRREAHLKQSRIVKGVPQDEFLYVLLREEWIDTNSL